MYGTLKKIFAFAGSKKGLLKKSLLFSFLSGLFSAMQFAALFVVIGALVSDNRDGKFICISLGIMAVSLIGRIIMTYFSTMEQTETGYCMVAEKRIHIGDRLRYIPMGYFNKNSIGNITAIVTTTLGDVENSAARVLVSVLGGFFNSVALVIVLLVFDWRIGLVAAAGVLIYLPRSAGYASTHRSPLWSLCWSTFRGWGLSKHLDWNGTARSLSAVQLRRAAGIT